MSGLGCIAEGQAGSPEEIQFWMSGNICRCGAYPGIVAAITDAGKELTHVSLHVGKGVSAEAAIAAAGMGARYIAGGTTLVDLMRDEVERPERLIDINMLPLGGIRVEGEDLVIGALARMADVAADDNVRHLQPLIAESLIEGASPQFAEHGFHGRESAAAGALSILPHA